MYHHSKYGVTDAKVTLSRRYSSKGLSKIFDKSVVAMVTGLSRHWCRSMLDGTKSSGGAWQSMSAMRNKFSMTLLTEILSTETDVF